jgi:multiple sugar transport system permease protein
MSTNRMRKSLPYLLLLPAVIPVAILVFYPVCEAILASFFDSVGLKFSRESTFVGLSNYKAVIRGDFIKGIWLTLIYAIASIAGEYILGLITALALNRKFKGRTLARTLIVLPWAVPTVVVVIVWLWMFNPDYGIINYILSSTHIIKQNIRWISNPSRAFMAVVLTTVWKTYPIATLMLLAGLQTIPLQLYETADIDGANMIQKFRFITFPMLSAVNGILIILLLIWGIGKLVFILLMTQGGPAGFTETLPMKIYLQAFKFFNLGKAVALGVLMLIISFALTMVYMNVVYKAKR